MADNKNTQYFKVNNETDIAVKDILEAVYIALTEKGYNPVNQIVGYIMSGDPTYVTSYKNARYLIMKVERDELLEELLNSVGQIIDICICPRFLKKRGNKLLVFFILLKKLTKSIIGFGKELSEEFKR